MNALLRRALAASLSICLAAAPTFAAGKVAGPALPPLVVEGLEPIGKYRIFLDGKPVSEQHISVAAASGSVYLLQGKELGEGLLIRPRERDIIRLAKGNVQPQMDGTFVVDAGGPGDLLGPFEVDKEGLFFAYEGKKVLLGQAPIFLGDRSADELLDKQDGYAFRARKFVPKPSALEFLAKVPDEIRVKTFFGSWCGACSQKLPGLLRVAQDLRGRKFQFEFYGLPSPFKGEPEAVKYKVTSVPTGVVLRGDVEIGRLAGADWESPAVLLRRIVERAGKPSP